MAALINTSFDNAPQIFNWDQICITRQPHYIVILKPKCTQVFISWSWALLCMKNTFYLNAIVFYIRHIWRLAFRNVSRRGHFQVIIHLKRTYYQWFPPKYKPSTTFLIPQARFKYHPFCQLSEPSNITLYLSMNSTFWKPSFI